MSFLLTMILKVIERVKYQGLPFFPFPWPSTCQLQRTICKHLYLPHNISHSTAAWKNNRKHHQFLASEIWAYASQVCFCFNLTGISLKLRNHLGTGVRQVSQLWFQCGNERRKISASLGSSEQAENLALSSYECRSKHEGGHSEEGALVKKRKYVM